MGLRLVFKSEGGHFGTMKMMGGMGKNLEHVKEYWVLQRQSIPGFLAQVTLEAFEKTTVRISSVDLIRFRGNETDPCECADRTACGLCRQRGCRRRRRMITTCL
jgi:allantoicase